MTDDEALTPAQVIADALRERSDYEMSVSADDVLAALDQAGYVIVPRPAIQRTELVREVAEALEDESHRRTLVNYWFETVGGGWVKPDWTAIADLAVGVTLTLTAHGQTGDMGALALNTAVQIATLSAGSVPTRKDS